MNPVLAKLAVATAEAETAKRSVDSRVETVERAVANVKRGRYSSLGELQGAGPMFDVATALLGVHLEWLRRMRDLVEETPIPAEEYDESAWVVDRADRVLGEFGR